jgi:hypothetical protein
MHNEEVNALFLCPDYNSEKQECNNCNFIANFRKEAADMIIKAN